MSPVELQKRIMQTAVQSFEKAGLLTALDRTPKDTFRAGLESGWDLAWEVATRYVERKFSNEPNKLPVAQELAEEMKQLYAKRSEKETQDHSAREGHETQAPAGSPGI